MCEVVFLLVNDQAGTSVIHHISQIPAQAVSYGWNSVNGVAQDYRLLINVPYENLRLLREWGPRSRPDDDSVAFFPDSIFVTREPTAEVLALQSIQAELATLNTSVTSLLSVLSTQLMVMNGHLAASVVQLQEIAKPGN